MKRDYAVMRRELLNGESTGRHIALTGLALEFGCSFSQGAIGTDIVIQTGEKQIAISIRHMDSVMARERILGRSQKSGHDEIGNRLMGGHRCLLDFLFRLRV